MSRSNEYFYEANDAEIYVGEEYCDSLPSIVEIDKLYTFDCEIVGDYVKVASARDDGKLSFVSVQVTGKNM